MATKKKPKNLQYESDSYDDYDDYEDEFDDKPNHLKGISRDFYSSDWENESGSERRFSTRRKIERRNDLKALYAQFDDGDELDFANDW